MTAVLDAITSVARARPSSDALRGRMVLTYGALADEVARVADLLDNVLGDAPCGAPVAIALDNGPEWVVLDLALMRLGRAVLPLPPFFNAEMTAHALSDAGASHVITPKRETNHASFHVASSEVGLQALPFASARLHPDTSKVTYTSGSTGRPKGVCLSGSHLERLALALVDVIGATFAGVHVPVLPLGVLLENVAGLYPTLLAGGCYHAPGLAEIGFASPFQPDFVKLAGALRATRATSAIMVPEMLRGLVAALSAMGERLPDMRLIAVGGAKVPATLLKSAGAAGLPVFEGYGLSECGSVVALNCPGRNWPSTVGKTLPHLQVQISGDGEIHVGPSPFLGYVGGAAQDGALATGDLGAMDEEGCLRVLGRKSNLIITSFGRNIAPEWIESELLAEPEIAQAVVCGDGEPHLSAIIVASSAARPTGSLDAAVARVNARLPAYARIIRWRESAPFDPSRGEMTANGRPVRHRLHAAHSDFIAGRTQERA